MYAYLPFHGNTPADSLVFLLCPQFVRRRPITKMHPVDLLAASLRRQPVRCLVLSPKCALLTLFPHP